MGHISICGVLVQVVKRFGATNGCSVVPNSWLNEEVRVMMMMMMMMMMIVGMRSNFLPSLKLSTRRALYMTSAIPQLGQIALFVTGGRLCLDVGI